MATYYYFYKNRQVSELPFKIQSYDTNYEKLTTKQANFYKAHKDASVYEIRRCELNPTPTPPEEDINEVRKTVMSELSAYSLATLDKFCTTYQFANAQSSLMEIEEGKEGIYTEEKAHKYLTDYAVVGKKCRTLYYEAKDAVEEADTIDRVKELETEYKIYFDAVDSDPENEL